LLARKIFHRERSYSDFITESTRVLVDALDSPALNRAPAHQAGALTVLRTLDMRSFQSDHLLAE
jgi:hypothetical protein